MAGGEHAATFHMAVILADLALVLVLARAVGWVFSRLRQPAVVGEILAGVLLGPTLLGRQCERLALSQWTNACTCPCSPIIGLVLFMFIVGLELDISLVRGRERVAGAVSASSIALPFALGIALARYLPNENDKPFWPFALFIGAAMSVTAFPVLARIMTERNMHRTETGALALACAAVDDVLAWSLLAVVIAIAPKPDGIRVGRVVAGRSRRPVRCFRSRGGTAAAGAAHPRLRTGWQAHARNPCRRAVGAPGLRRHDRLPRHPLHLRRLPVRRGDAPRGRRQAPPRDPRPSRADQCVVVAASLLPGLGTERRPSRADRRTAAPDDADPGRGHQRASSSARMSAPGPAAFARGRHGLWAS